MPKLTKFPTLYDECKTISITFLKEHGYLKPSQSRTGTVHWSRNGNRYASISIGVNMTADQPYLALDYKCNGQPINYKVHLVCLPSNIGKGTVWYFLCPSTGKRCRKLYMADTYFLHRSAFKGCMYEKQTYSKSARQDMQAYSRLFGTENAYEQLYSKHFKKTYAGKPTERYLKLCKKLNNIVNTLIEFKIKR